jgi:hypothetical protein
MTYVDIYDIYCREATLRGEGCTDEHLIEFLKEDFNKVVAGRQISVIKQAGAYSSVRFREMFVMKDIYKFGSPTTNLETFL